MRISRLWLQTWEGANVRATHSLKSPLLRRHRASLIPPLSSSGYSALAAWAFPYQLNPPRRLSLYKNRPRTRCLPCFMATTDPLNFQTIYPEHRSSRCCLLPNLLIVRMDSIIHDHRIWARCSHRLHSRSTNSRVGLSMASNNTTPCHLNTNTTMAFLLHLRMSSHLHLPRVKPTPSSKPTRQMPSSHSTPQRHLLISVLAIHSLRKHLNTQARMGLSSHQLQSFHRQSLRHIRLVS